MNRRSWRVGAVGALLSLALSFGLGVDEAPAEPQDPHHHHTDAEHAAEDLVGTPITEIERQTRATAARIKDSTGAGPGWPYKDAEGA